MGAAVTALYDVLPEITVGVGGDPSSTLAELVALSQASTSIVSSSQSLSSAIILTDSLASLDLLSDRQKETFPRTESSHELHSTVEDLVQSLNKCVQLQISVQLVKVKSHVLEPLNERADQLANLAAELLPTVWAHDPRAC